MNTRMKAISNEEDVYWISVDMAFYEIEQIDDTTCFISHKTDPTKQFEVLASFTHLHQLANGFDVTTMN